MTHLREMLTSLCAGDEGTSDTEQDASDSELVSGMMGALVSFASLILLYGVPSCSHFWPSTVSHES